MKSSSRHNQLKLFLVTTKRSHAGFTMLDSIVGILVISLFVGLAMQGLAVGALLKANARNYSEALAWIQQDMENVKYQAATYKSNSLSLAAAANAASIVVASAIDFEINDKINIGTDTTAYTISGISGNTLAISPNLATSIPVNAKVVATQSVRCGTSVNPPTITTGFADGLRDKFVGTNSTATSNNYDITKTSSNSGKQLRLRRSTTLANAYPYNVLQVDYTVSEVFGNSSFGVSMANLRVEVLPDTALSCP
jgi:type II secretory pathway pseudopilin PulG